MRRFSVLSVPGALLAPVALLHVLVPGDFAAAQNDRPWLQGRVPFQVNPNFPELGGTPEQQVEMLRCAARAWRDQTRAELRFLYQGTSNRQGFRLADGINNISWVSRDGGEALAATQIGVDRANRRLTSFDIVFFGSTNGTANAWSGPGEPERRMLDITGVATHELGHALGLEHLPDPRATMFASAQNRGLTLRTLNDSDRAAVEPLYGTRDAGEPAVEIVSVTPAFGPATGGNEVVLRGVNFTYESETQLVIGGFAISRSRWTVESCDRLRIVSMPPHDPGPVDITVTNSIGTGTAAASYRHGGPPLQVLSVEPVQGPTGGGIPLTVSGEGFTADAVVTVGGAPLREQRVLNSGSITGILPPSGRAGPVDLRVRRGQDEAVLPGGFTYNPYVLRLGTATATPGAQAVAVPVLATSPDPLSAVSFAMTHEPASLMVNEISTAGTPAEGADFAEARIDATTGVTTFGLVMSFDQSSRSLPAGEDVSVAAVLVTVSRGVEEGAVLPLRLVSGAGSPPVDILFTRADSGAALKPLTADGTVRIFRNTFVRGDADGDGQVNITDALFHLGALFLGGPPGRCPDAADSNDDGRLEITDAIYTLNFLFLGGPPFPPPHPLPGADPTADALPCF